jgi:hypothetical protein
MNREVASSEKLSSGETAYGETKYLWMNVKVLSIIVGCTFIVVRIPLFFFVIFFSRCDDEKTKARLVVLVICFVLLACGPLRALLQLTTTFRDYY